MNKKVLGLPLYLWVGTLASATAIVYYVQQRRRQKQAEQDAQNQQGIDPTVCDPTSDNYDEQLCMELQPDQTDVSDTGDPCDPSSVNYDPVACEADAGLQLSYGQSPGGIGGYGGFTGGGTADGSSAALPPDITIEAPQDSSGNSSGDVPPSGTATTGKRAKKPSKGAHGRKPKRPHRTTGGGHNKFGPVRSAVIPAQHRKSKRR